MAKANLAETITFSVTTRIVEARTFVDVVRFNRGEIVVPDQSKITRLEVWSGPAGCSQPQEFRQKNDGGRPIVLLVKPGQPETLPPAFFSAHAVAIVGDEEGPITLRLKG